MIGVDVVDTVTFRSCFCRTKFKIELLKTEAL